VTDPGASLRLLAFAGSLREGSLNRKLIGMAAGIARGQGAAVDLVEFRELDVPSYNADVESRDGIPAGAQEFKRRLEPSQGLLIASPEYNHSVPGTLKNVIDWVSRFRPAPLRGKSALLLSTSRGLVGGNRGLWALRVPLEHLGVHVYPDMFSLAEGDRKLDAAGSLSDPAAVERLERLIAGYCRVARALSVA
jgi:NAD(P)H-dependent FMN reductase